MRAEATQTIHLSAVIERHADELGDLWNTRRTLEAAGHARLSNLLRFDDRILAHEDGCTIAGRAAWDVLQQRFAEPSPPALFAATLVALDLADAEALERCLAVAEAAPASVPGVAAALGWVSGARLTHIGKQLLTAPSPFRRRLGLSACRMHLVDPGPILVSGLSDPDAGLRAEALHLSFALGKRDSWESIKTAMSDTDPACRIWACAGAAALGEHALALEGLLPLVSSPGPARSLALALALRVMAPPQAHALLQEISRASQDMRLLIEGAGVAGDSRYAAWLIDHMRDVKFARLAGEAFSLITGVDLAVARLDRRRPDDVDAVPGDDPDDSNVEADADDGLPWPDPEKISSWWKQNKTGFAEGARYFMGAPISAPHCVRVLHTAYQRQRIAAAQYLRLQFGMPLFNTGAPAWRQQRLLAKLP